MQLISIIVLILSIVIHEVAHGYAADLQGDHTPRLAGRLTLNPIPHIDLWGSIILPAIMVLSGTGIVFGWAKPVPFNTRNLTDKRYGPLWVALAGPAVNLVLALVFGLAIRFLGTILPPSMLMVFGLITIINLVLAIFNLIPIPPLDGHHIVSAISPRWYAKISQQLRQYAFVFIVVVVLFIWPLVSPLIDFAYIAIVGAPFGVFAG